MAPPSEDVEQLLAARVTTPIAQLSPDLPDQGSRKIHGEVTITWPYSSVAKSFAFLLAEPDFRRRRDRGSVRIQLSGPSAEAVGSWELGSGDEVVLALDAVEWARDEEPARPAGSRLDWQLKFAGRLVLRAALGETQEIKLLSIDQPFTAQEAPPEAAGPPPVAEADTAVLPDEPVATPAKPSAQTVLDDIDDDREGEEYASPIFAKRLRPSYGPLFELNLDEELEADGGRRGMGRKRPRYSVQNRMWRYREDSSSPEPGVSQDSPSAAQGQNGNLSMQDTPARVKMTDGEAQTNEFELAPPPSSSFNTPIKGWGRSQASPSFFQGVTQAFGMARTDTGVQAAPWKPAAPIPNEHAENMTEHAASNPFGSARPGYSPSVKADSHPLAGFGVSQGSTAPVSLGSRERPSISGPAPTGGMLLASAAVNDAGSAHGSSPPLETGPSSSADQSFGAASSLFGTMPTPAQSVFSQVPMTSSGFGAAGGSLRFGFGQESQPSHGGSPFAHSAVAAQHPDAHPYPESYPDQQHPPASAPLTPQNPFVSVAQDAQPLLGHGPSVNQNPIDTRLRDHSVPLWPLGTQEYDDRHAVGLIHPAEDLRSDGDMPEVTPPGIISPEVDDGTRNADEMRQEGLLSMPVYRQGVPQEALPGQVDASADEDAMDSDEEADYDEDQKGDDYDLRNYDRLSDDEEGYDEDEPLSSDELLEEDEQPFYGGDHGYDRNDYDEEDYEDDEAENYFSQASRLPHHQPQAPPRPAAPKQPVVIDLLSDSDDDAEPPARPVIQTQTPQKRTHEPATLGSVRDQGDRPTQPSQLSAMFQQPPQDLGSHQEEDASEGEPEEEDPNHNAKEKDDDSEDAVEESDGDEDAAAGSDHGEDGVEGEGMDEDTVSVRETNVTVGTVVSVVEVEEEATVPSPGRTHDTAISGSEGILDREKQDEITTADVEYWMRRPSNGPQVAIDVDEEHEDDASESFQSQVTDMGNHSPISQDEEMADELVDEDNRQEGAGAPSERGELGLASSQADVARQDSEENLTQAQQTEKVEGPGEEMQTEAVEDAAAQAIVGPETREPEEDAGNPSDQQQDAPPSPPESQDHQADRTAKVDVAAVTAVAEHVETRVGEQHETLSVETQQTEPVLYGRMTAKTDGRRDPQSEDVEMVDAAEEHTEEQKINEEVKDAQPRSAQEKEAGDDDSVDLLTAEAEPTKRDLSPASAQNEETELPKTPAAIKEGRLSPQVDDGTHNGVGGDAHDSSDKLDLQKSYPVATENVHASVVATTSQVPDVPEEADEVETTPSSKPKRGGRKTRGPSNSRPARSTTASKKGQRQASSEQAPGSQRTTRSKAMSFQKAPSPEEDKEDMSIQLARAALKSPTTKTKHKRKVSASSAKREKTDLVKRLEDDMPDCAALRDLRKYNNHVVRLDVAVVATSAQTSPKRTATREYASSFTATDPSIAPDTVVEIDLYSLHRDHLPLVGRGDSVLLRGFTVVSLPGRGFGLKTEKNESSWAVFKAGGGGGGDEPEMRAAPVELNDREKKFLLDLRGWYAGLDEGAKDMLRKAVDEVVESGRASREKK